ncbi:MFS general substrate transporter [Curvularia clavata]|uniref:MFS general substrate transporter n=1 Tax=Curvularia clavata TaxID=95742 RepID=A0A9Q8Z6K5_CURCL|nr:MFS general substrate transporter [Curvularia clavata]
MAEESNIPYTLQLSTKICDRLPRELRNQIYSLLDLEQETKRSKPIDDFVGDQFCEQFSRECLLWYYENVSQMLHRPFFIYYDIKRLIQLYPKVKKSPGLTIVLEASQPDFEFEDLTTLMDMFKATGYFDDLNKDFKVCIYIDLAIHHMWRSMNPNVEQAIVFSQSILQYFRMRIKDTSCFVRLMEAEEYEAREVGMNITENLEESMDEILERIGCLVHVGMKFSTPKFIMYKTCKFFFIVFGVTCAASNSLGSLVAYRFLAGAMGSCSMTIGTGSIADIFPAEKHAVAMGTYVIGIKVGPTIGPIVGGFLAPVAGWRWGFWVVAIASGCVTIVVILRILESYPYAILGHKARRLQEETRSTNLRSVLHTGKTPKNPFTYSITRPVKIPLLPIVLLLSLYVASLYAYLYLCFTTFEVVFSRQYGISSGEAGLANLGIGFDSALGCAGSVAANEVSRKLAEKHGGDPKSEYQLPIMILGGFCTPISLFWYGWSAFAKVHWIVPIIGSSFIGMNMAFTFMPTTIYLVELYTVHTASMTAANTILRCLLGALLPLAGTPLYDNLGLCWAKSLPGFISIVFFPVPFIWYLYGEHLENAKIFKVEF